MLQVGHPADPLEIRPQRVRAGFIQPVWELGDRSVNYLGSHFVSLTPAQAEACGYSPHLSFLSREIG